MSRLIDAEALKKMFEKCCTGECDCCSHKKYGNCDLIDNAPTIEPMSVLIGGRRNGKTQALLESIRPKGKWESRYCVGDAYYHVCSECKMHIRENGFDNYCSNCGANMVTDLCSICKHGDNCERSDKGVSFANHSACWKFER